MKHKPYMHFNLFHKKKWILTTFLLLTSIATPQHTVDKQFQIGASFSTQTRVNKAYYEAFKESGMNLIVQYASEKTKPFLSDYNFIAFNGDSRDDYIYHYSTAFYSKWEAEENQKTWDKIGIKHKDGKEEKFKGIKCWSSKGISKPTRSIVYGPHYHQEKLYKRWYWGDKSFDRHKVKYTVRFRMALDVSGNVNQNEEVCKLYVSVRHVPVSNNTDGNKIDHILKGPITLKVSDFKPNGAFDYFYLDNSAPWYTYPVEYHENPPAGVSNTTTWIDKYGDQGIQFCVDWLRKDTRCTLYIDYIEVYDNDGWNRYLDPDTRESVIRDIQTYAEKYSSWSNLKYWGGCDEPSSIDAYIPIRIVDSLIQDVGAPPLMSVFYPQWDVTVNNDSQLVRYYNTVKPEKLLIDFFPFLPQFPVPRWDDWYWFQKQLQICHSLQPGFYYQAQAFGYQKGEMGSWEVWRQPTSTELKASVMLALAHGVKGIIFFQLDSYPMGDGLILQGILKNNLPNYTKTELWYLVKEDLVPRLKGKLGKKLMELDYTGNYIQYYKIGNKQSEYSMHQMSDDFIGVGFGQPQAEEMNWHCGLFTRQNNPDDKYFFLINLYTTANSRSIPVSITDKGQEYENYRFRNIESNFDTTFTGQFTTNLIQSKGEGYLFQVAPVIKYGGRLRYSEETKDGMELTDDMIIENGAVLTINGNYYSKANIIVKNGRVSYINNGKVHFAENKKLITN